MALWLYLEITYFYYCWKRCFDWAFILWGNTFYFCCRFCMQRTNRVYNYAVFYYHVRRHFKKYHIFFCFVVFGTLKFVVVVLKKKYLWIMYYRLHGVITLIYSGQHIFCKQPLHLREGQINLSYLKLFDSCANCLQWWIIFCSSLEINPHSIYQ